MRDPTTNKVWKDAYVSTKVWLLSLFIHSKPCFICGCAQSVQTWMTCGSDSKWEVGDKSGNTDMLGIIMFCAGVMEEYLIAC